MMRPDPEEFRRLPLRVHALLDGVPLRDVSCADLAGGGAGRSLADVRALFGARGPSSVSPVVRFLFALRFWIGRRLRWDDQTRAPPTLSYLGRVDAELAGLSVVPPGTPDGSFTILYQLPREMLSEIRNATVHAFLASVLEERAPGYRLYWAVYVLPVSRFTRVYMAVIEPFRRWIVYPAIFRWIRRAWARRYGSP